MSNYLSCKSGVLIFNLVPSWWRKHFNRCPFLSAEGKLARTYLFSPKSVAMKTAKMTVHVWNFLRSAG